jgi:hypothetical protein
MSRLAAVPDFGASGSLYQYVEVTEPGEPGYPTPRLPESDPWAPAVNRAIDEIEAARPDAYLANDPYADLAAEPSFLGGLPEDRITVNAEHEIVAAPELETEPVSYTLTPRAEAVLASWDRFRALGEAEPELEAGL